jgi:hypothetical protein
MTTEPVTIDPDTINAIAERAARRTVELLQQSRSGESMPHLVDAATLARALGVSRDCVYAHASELGGERIGAGPRGRLRFDLDQALAAWTSRSISKESQGPESRSVVRGSTHRRRRPLGSGPELLPIRGTTGRSDASSERS